MCYSVLMSVYQKEDAGNLQKAIDSIWAQTVPTDDFILVCDGPLNEDLDRVINNMEKTHPAVFHVVRLETNCGLGNALRTGLQRCRNDLIARMDSDDISRPDRCEKQLEIFQKHPEISICSGIVEEFQNTPADSYSRRVPPENQKEILSFMKRRNPFNHPCVMYRKSAVEAAGGYQDFYLLEDYFLWVRMLKNGCIGYNIQQPLLWMRAGSGMYKRRAGWKYVKSQIALYRFMKDIHFISYSECFTICLVRTVSSLMPNIIRETAFKLLLRRNSA